MITGSADFSRRKGVLSSRASYTGVPGKDHDEKPWQRVVSDVTGKKGSLHEPVKSVPCPLLLVLLGAYFLVGYFVNLIEHEMPSVVEEENIPANVTDIFSESTAKRYLHTILGDQPRVAGTSYHEYMTRQLKELVDSVAVQANIPVRTDWQLASHDFWLTFNPPHVNLYQNVSNVIALLEGESGFRINGTLNTSLLINCHYDSVPFAMGASDNAIFCAVMVEVLSRLSKRNVKPKHNIIFLFNGAEEIGLYGSHGFLSHPWARGVTNVINLDAVGMNGKPIVFQVSDPRLLSVYRKITKRPSGQSVAEFLFKAGVIPSDTDFRIWRDFGDIHGVDLAFCKYSWVYHTRYDHPSTILPGVIQNAGDTLLGLIRETADLAELDTQITPSALVYYDYLHWFMVTYSFSAAVAVDLLLGVVMGLVGVGYYVWLVGPRWSTVRDLLMCCVGRMVSLVAGVLVAAVCTPLMVVTTVQLRYLSEPWLVVAVYWTPLVTGAAAAALAWDAGGVGGAGKSGLNRSLRTLQAQAATRLILTVILLILTCIPSVATLRYVLTVPLFIMTLMSLVSVTVIRYFRLTAWQHLIMEFLLSLPSAMFLMSLAIKFNSIMLPTMARNVSSYPDYTIAALNIGLAILVATSASGIELLFSRCRLWVVVAPLGLACFILMFIPFSPYQDEGLSVQRHYWFHTTIISHDHNNVETERISGVLVTKHDAYTTSSVLPELKRNGFNLNSRTDFGADCDRYVHCNLPLYRLRFGAHLKDSLFLYTGPPDDFEASTRVESRNCVGITCTLNIVMNGPAHNLITIWPRADVNVTSWSFSSPLQPSFTHNDRPVYVIVETTATYSPAFQPQRFALNLTVPINLQSQPILDVSHHAHKIHHPEDFTVEYRNLVDAAPKYFNIASFISFRKNYVF